MRPVSVLRRKIKVIWHVPAWLLLFALPFLLCSVLGYKTFCFTKPNLHYGWLLVYIATCLLVVGTTYFNANLLMPKIVQLKKRGFGYFVPLLLSLAILLIIPLLFFAFSKIEGFRHYDLSIFFALYILPYLLIFASSMAYQVVKGGMHLGNLVIEDKSETERLENEVAFLRSQAGYPLVNHGLKNIVLLAGKQPEQLEPSLVKLSTLMDYMLHKPANGKVGLEQEVENLKTYIELTQQGGNSEINFYTAPDIVYRQYEIRPMQLIPFIETIFKNSTSTPTRKKIELDLNTKKKLLTIVVKTTAKGAARVNDDGGNELHASEIKHKLMINCFRKLD